MKHNDLDLLNKVRNMTAAELDALVLAGNFHITTLDYPSDEAKKPIELTGGWRLHFIQPKAVDPKYKHNKRFVRVNVTSTDQRTGKIRCAGEEKFAYDAGLELDHAYNWRNNYNANRFRHLDLLVVLQNNEKLRQYIKTCPVIVTEQGFSKWIDAAPTDSQKFKSIERGEVARLTTLMDQVIRTRMTYEECHEMREDQRAERARARGETYERRPPKVWPLEERGDRRQFQRREHANSNDRNPRAQDGRNRNGERSNNNANGNRTPRGDQGARDFNKVPAGGIGEFLSAKPTYEERKRGNKRDKHKQAHRERQYD